MKKAVILAAGMGTRLRSVTNNLVPKPFLKISGKSLIERSIEKLKEVGVEEIIIVTGHLSHFFDELKNKYTGIRTIKNENFAITGSIASFYCTKELIGNDDILLLEGDLIYEVEALKIVINDKNKNCILLSEDKKMTDDYYVALSQNNNIEFITNDFSKIKGKFGEWTGIQKLSNDLCKKMFQTYLILDNKKMSYEGTLEVIAKDELVFCKRVDGILWSEIDDKIQLDKVMNGLYQKLLEKGEKKYEII